MDRIAKPLLLPLIARWQSVACNSFLTGTNIFWIASFSATPGAGAGGQLSADLVLAFDEIRYCGASSIQVMRRMRALLLDLRNARKGLAGEEGLETTVTVPSGRLCMRVRFDHATNRARAEHELVRPDGIRISSAFDVRIYSEAELARMIGKAGMRVVAVHGSLDGAPFGAGAERMVVIARRE